MSASDPLLVYRHVFSIIPVVKRWITNWPNKITPYANLQENEVKEMLTSDKIGRLGAE